jgi:hypothetical protein
MINGTGELITKLARIGFALSGESAPSWCSPRGSRSTYYSSAREYHRSGYQPRHYDHYIQATPPKKSGVPKNKTKKFIVANDGLLEHYSSSTITPEELEAETKHFIEVFTGDGSFKLEHMINRKRWRKLIFSNGRIRMIHKFKFA